MVRLKTLTSRLLALPLCFGCVAVVGAPATEVYELIHVVNCQLRRSPSGRKALTNGSVI